MTVKDDLHHLVDQLDEDVAHEALTRLNDLHMPRETSLTTRQLDALAAWLADQGYRIIGPGLDNQADVHRTSRASCDFMVDFDTVFDQVRQCGDHMVMQHQAPGSTSTMPLPDRCELRTGTLQVPSLP